jgi:phage shock protein A
MASSSGHAQAVGYDASVSQNDLRDPRAYLAQHIEDLEHSVDAADAVAAGAKQTAASLRDELKQARAALKAHDAGQGN